MTGLEISAIHARFGRHEVLRGVDLAVAPGETLVLFGPSGAGKTVLLRAIAGLEPGALGQVVIDGQDVSARGPEARNIGMAFQNFALYPHMSARDNIASPLVARGLPADEIATRVAEITQLLRIGHVLSHPPRALSNGQKQRTALARALVGRPRVLLLDDPLRNVDAKLRYEMRLELPRLLRESQAATLYVTQDYREAMALGDRVAVLRAGRIEQCDASETVYDRPATAAVARLFGDPPVNLLACRPVADPAGLRAEAAGFRLVLDASAEAAGKACLLGLRPETLSLAAAGPDAARLEVIATTPLHERLVVLLRAGDGTEIVASLLGAAPAPGAQVAVAADAAAALLFDAASGARIPARRVRAGKAA